MKYTMAKYTVKPEAVKAVRRAIAEFVDEVRKHEPRTLYVAFREEGQHTFVHWMRFENEAAERRHAQARYSKRFAHKLSADLRWQGGLQRVPVVCDHQETMATGAEQVMVQWVLRQISLP